MICNSLLVCDLYRRSQSTYWGYIYGGKISEGKMVLWHQENAYGYVVTYNEREGEKIVHAGEKYWKFHDGKGWPAGGAQKAVAGVMLPQLLYSKEAHRTGSAFGSLAGRKMSRIEGLIEEKDGQD
jgi:hypothetical protein